MNDEHTVEALYEEEDTSFNLTVESTHGQGAKITVSPYDLNGSGGGFTHFDRTYYKGTVVTLTAPSNHHQNGKIFSHWKVDGTTKTSNLTIQVTMGRNHKAKAYYRDSKSKSKK
jgi:hypothetical protein